MELSYKRRSANPMHVQSGDDQSKIFSKLRLLHEAKSFGSVANPLHVVEAPLQDRFPQERLERIVVHQ